jgi:hypothetical protein
MRILALVILMLRQQSHLYTRRRRRCLCVCVAFSRSAGTTAATPKSYKWMANKQALIPHQNQIKMGPNTKEFPQI